MPTPIFARKQLSLRVAYVGPGLGGKTTNLQRLGELFPEAHLTPIPTAGERTYGGDFLPVGMEPLGEWSPRLQLCSVPGQAGVETYEGTRETLLRGVDVVVFVADSLRLRLDANLYALDELQRTLARLGREPAAVPVVFQYNKRDLHDVLPCELLEARLNPGGAPAVRASALRSIGVLETFAEAAALARQVGAEFLGGGGRRAGPSRRRPRTCRARTPPGPFLSREVIGMQQSRVGKEMDAVRWVRARRRLRDQGGFTMIEFVIMLGLLVILGGLAVAGYGWLRPLAARQAVTHDLESIVGPLEQHYNDYNQYPTTITGTGTRSATTMVYQSSPGVTLSVVPPATGAVLTIQGTHAKRPGMVCTSSIVDFGSTVPECTG